MALIILELKNFNDNLKLRSKKIDPNDVIQKVHIFVNLLKVEQKKAEYEASGSEFPFHYNFPLYIEEEKRYKYDYFMFSPTDMYHLTTITKERQEIAKLSSKINDKFRNYFWSNIIKVPLV
jgi:hypothetical protein